LYSAKSKLFFSIFDNYSIDYLKTTLLGKYKLLLIELYNNLDYFNTILCSLTTCAIVIEQMNNNNLLKYLL